MLSLFSPYLRYKQIELTRVAANQPVAIGLKYKLERKTEMWQRTQRENRMDTRFKLNIFQSFSIWLAKIKLGRELYVHLMNIWRSSVDIIYQRCWRLIINIIIINMWQLFALSIVNHHSSWTVWEAKRIICFSIRWLRRKKRFPFNSRMILYNWSIWKQICKTFPKLCMS